MPEDPAESAAIQFTVKRTLRRRFFQAFFGALFGIIFPLSVLGAAGGAIANFAHGSIPGGLFMLVMGSVLGFCFIIPTVVGWAKFRRAFASMELRFDSAGLTMVFSGSPDHPIHWSRFSEVSLDEHYFTVRTPQTPLSIMFFGAGRTWFRSRTSRLLIDDSELQKAISRFRPEL